MISVASQKPCHFSAVFSRGNGYKSDGCRSGDYGVCFGIVELLFDKKSFIKEKSTVGSPFFRGVSFWPRRQGDEGC
jgi:hypothetical protein